MTKVVVNRGLQHIEQESVIAALFVHLLDTFGIRICNWRTRETGVSSKTIINVASLLKFFN